MLFNDRTALGKTLAARLQQYRGKDAVVLCLKDRSLLTSVMVAADLRAWVYPLLSVPVYSQDLTRQLYGAFDQDGTFCINPDIAEQRIEDFSPEVRSYIESQRTAAIYQVTDQAAKFEMTFNKEVMHGRDVIIVGDIVDSAMPFALAAQLLSSIRPKSISVAVGDTTPSGAAAARLLAEQPIILDVLSGIVLDDDHYFEHDDAYDDEQKYALTQHIAAYWH